MSQNIVKLLLGVSAVNIAGTISLIGLNLYDMYKDKKKKEEKNNNNNNQKKDEKIENNFDKNKIIQANEKEKEN
jgi:hypothetical protein